MKQMDVVNTDLFCFNKEKIISLTTNYNMIMGTFEYEQFNTSKLHLIFKLNIVVFFQQQGMYNMMGMPPVSQAGYGNQQQMQQMQYNQVSL